VTVVGGIALALVLLATLAATIHAFAAGWLGFRDQWRRLDPQRRRRGLLGGLLAGLLFLAEATVLIAAPWARQTIFYVIVVGGGTLMLLSLSATAVRAVRDTRRAGRRRRERS
jgi:hypothetical protein